jgi:hypothetical protein
MKIVAHELGQLVYLVPAEEVRPVHHIPVQDVIAKLADRYRFASLPELSELWTKLNAEGLKFRDGRILRDGAPVGVIEFGIHNDGLMVKCRKTDDADFFLKDVLEWAQSELGFRKPTRPPRILYQSQVVVEFEKKLSSLVKDFAKLSKLLSEAYASQYEIQEQVDLSRIAFRCDPLKLPAASAPAEFLVERRANRSYSEERYFAAAPFPSALHVKLLQKLEGLI